MKRGVAHASLSAAITRTITNLSRILFGARSIIKRYQSYIDNFDSNGGDCIRRRVSRRVLIVLNKVAPRYRCPLESMMIGYTFNTPLEPITYRHTPDNETCRYGIEFFARFSFLFFFLSYPLWGARIKKEKKGGKKERGGGRNSFINRRWQSFDPWLVVGQVDRGGTSAPV